jgi:hypothetical protein
MEVGDVQDYVNNGNDIKPLSQKDSTTCWRTAYAMMLQYKGKLHADEDIEFKLDQVESDAGWDEHFKDWDASHPNDLVVDAVAEKDIYAWGTVKGLYPEQLKFAAKALGLQSKLTSSLKDEDSFAQVVKDHGPLWCCGRYIDEKDGTVGKGLHAIVVLGIQKTQMHTLVWVLDPFGIWNTGQGKLNYSLTLSDFNSRLLKEPYAVQVWPKA